MGQAASSALARASDGESASRDEVGAARVSDDPDSASCSLILWMKRKRKERRKRSEEEEDERRRKGKRCGTLHTRTKETARWEGVSRKLGSFSQSEHEGKRTDESIKIDDGE